MSVHNQSPVTKNGPWVSCVPRSARALSRCALLLGLAALAMLIAALCSGTWLIVREPVPDDDAVPDIRDKQTVRVRVGLWRVCPSVRLAVGIANGPTLGCSKVPYVPWKELRPSDLGLGPTLTFTPTFVSRMRMCTPLLVLAAFVLAAGIFCAMLGHRHQDRRTVVGCGLLLLGGLALAVALLVFASGLADSYWDSPPVHIEPLPEYRYGWGLFAAAAAMVLSQVAAVLSLSAFLRRFPFVEDMVRVTVPGGDRRLRECQRASYEQLLYLPGRKYITPGTVVSHAYREQETVPSGTGRPIDIHVLSLEGQGQRPGPDVCASNEPNNPGEFNTYSHLNQFASGAMGNLPPLYPQVSSKTNHTAHIRPEPGCSSSNSSTSNYSTTRLPPPVRRAPSVTFRPAEAPTHSSPRATPPMVTF